MCVRVYTFPPLYLGRVISIPTVSTKRWAQLTVRHTHCCHCVSLLLHQADRAAHICAHCCLPFCACHHIYLTSTMLLLCSTCELFTSVSALACATHISMKKRGEWVRERKKLSVKIYKFFIYTKLAAAYTVSAIRHGDGGWDEEKWESETLFCCFFSNVSQHKRRVSLLLTFFPSLLLLDFSCHLRLFLLLFFFRVWAWDERGWEGSERKQK